MKNILSVEKIEKYYGNKDNVTKAIDNISLKVDEGEFVGIMGPSGSGKTTLLNCISTIDTVTTGNIIINGKDITKLKSKKLDKFRQNELGFIFQDFNLLDTLTAKIDGKIEEVAKYLGIEAILNKYPYQMSGGQRQRVASARAIVTDPSLILADEPTGALDSKSARLLLERFESLNQDLNATILMVTHDAFTASYAHRILFIKDGKIFTEVVRGNDSRKEFFNRIMEVITLIGGDDNNVF